MARRHERHRCQHYGETKLIEISDDSGATLDLIRAPLAKLDVTWRAAQH